MFDGENYLTLLASLIGVTSLITWLKNPYNGNKSEVEVYHISRQETMLMFIFAVIVTFIFYFILVAFNTANIVPSTISVTTSFLAVYLTFKRSPYYAMGYALNDVILIILWTMAAMEEIAYISVVVCFIAFFVNDIYGFINWHRMRQRQGSEAF